MSSLDWVPTHLRSQVKHGDDGVVTIQRPRNAELTFGSIPDGTTIRIIEPGRSPALTISAGHVGEDVTLVLRKARGHRFRIEGDFPVLDFEDPQSSITLELSTDDTLLRLDRGAYTVNSPEDNELRHGYGVRVRANSKGNTTLSGNARLKALEAEGSVVVKFDLKAHYVEVDGDLTVHGTLNADRVQVKKGLTCKGLMGGRGSARRLVVDGKVVGGTYDAEEFEINGDVSGKGDRPALTARTELLITGTVRNARLSCGQEEGGDGARLLIGVDKHHRYSPDEAECSEDGVDVWTPSSNLRKKSAKAVEDCVLDTTGSAQVVNEIRNSLINVAGQLQVAMGIDQTDLEATAVGQPSSLELDGANSDLEAKVSVKAGSLLVGEEISLREDQSVTVEETISCRSLSGGTIRATTIVAGAVSESTLFADQVCIEDSLQGSTLKASERIRILGKASADTDITFRGDAQFHGAIEANVKWLPQGSKQCYVEGDLGSLCVEGVDVPDGKTKPESEVPTLLLGPQGTVSCMEVSGAVVLDAEKERQKQGARHRRAKQARQLTSTVTLKAGSLLIVEFGRYELGTITCQGRTFLKSKDSRLSFCILETDDPDERGKPTRLSIRGRGTTVLEPPPERDRDEKEVRRPPEVQITGGQLEVEAELGRVLCGPREPNDETQPSPSLKIKAGGVIDSLVGEFRLEALQGRIRGEPGPGYLVRAGLAKCRDWPVLSELVGCFLSADRKPLDHEGLPRPAQLLRLSSDSDQRQSDDVARHPFEGGQLSGVDVTRLPYEDIESLRQLNVFTPDGPTLMVHATETRRAAEPAGRASGTTTRDGESYRRERSERLKRISDVVSDRAGSGGSRSATRWAAARAHHAAVTGRIERCLRFFHRLVGYHQRPLPALWSYITWVTVAALFLARFDSSPWCAPGEGGGAAGLLSDAQFLPAPYGFWDQVIRMITLPAGLLRLDVGGATTYAPISCSGSAHLGVLLVTGLLLAYFIVGLKNYLRTPLDT